MLKTINQSFGYNADDINEFITEIEDILYNYMYEHQNLCKESLEVEALRLENM